MSSLVFKLNEKETLYSITKVLFTNSNFLTRRLQAISRVPENITHF